MQELNDRDGVIIDPKVEKNKIERNLNMKRIYRIDHVYFHDSNSSCLLIESDLEPIALAKTIVAIIFKFEELVSESLNIDPVHLLDILKKFYNVKDVKEKYKNILKETEYLDEEDEDYSDEYDNFNYITKFELEDLEVIKIEMHSARYNEMYSSKYDYCFPNYKELYKYLVKDSELENMIADCKKYEYESRNEYGIRKYRYRLGYDYLFLPKKSFMYKGDLIGATSITILFKILDMEGNEILFETIGDKLDEQTLKLKNGEECYLCNLFKCYFDKELFKESNNFDFAPTIYFVESVKSGYSVSFEIHSYTKDIDNGILEATEIDRNEFIDIMKNNLDLFDTTDNKPAQSTSYVSEIISYSTEEVKRIDKEETKYYVYKTGEGLAGIASKEQEGMEENLICIRDTYEEAYNEMLNYIMQSNSSN